jgi:quercetin dioxygenase-like cupin family protein
LRYAFRVILRSLAGLGFLCLPGLVPPSLGHDSPTHQFQSKVITLFTEQLSANPNQELVARIYVLQPGSAVPRHYHDGEAFHVVLEGEWEAEVEGREVKLLKQGDTQFVPRGKWHGGKAVGTHPLRLLTVVVADKDKPLSTIIDKQH